MGDAPKVERQRREEIVDQVGSQLGDAPKVERQRREEIVDQVGSQLGDAPKDMYQRDVTGVVTSQPVN